ncbi:MAG: substrate-binding domain-containing protein [Herpetosiphon sp.]
MPAFEREAQVKVEVVAVGTGQALEIGRRGDADILLVHAPKQETAFVNAGDGINRLPVMHNDFVLVGPLADPAGLKGQTNASVAFGRIAANHAQFASRGDKSGTNIKEQELWKSAAITPTKDLTWYKSLGQGMGETLLFADEQNAYTLTDRGTYLAQKSHLPHLGVLVGGETIAENRDQRLLNPYGVIEVNPVKHPNVNDPLARKFEQWITSDPVQKMIAAFGMDRFGQPLFYPDAKK